MRSSWVRIGIALSLIWCACAFTVGWIEQRNENVRVGLSALDDARDRCVAIGVKSGIDCFAEGHRAYTVSQSQQTSPIAAGAIFAGAALTFAGLVSALVLRAVRWHRAGMYRI
jgi:hypothetical protein